MSLALKKILIPVTNHANLGETDKANGTYSPEITHAVHVFIQNGVDYEIASIKGGKAPIYGTDVEDDAINTHVLADEKFQQQMNNTVAVADLNINDYDAVFYPGGFGVLTDLAINEDFAKLSAAHYESGGVLSAVCHGPAGLLPIVLSSGEPLLADKSVTSFSREEEVDYGTIDDIPYLLEESLVRQAAKFSKAQPWQELVITDQRVITGQNPASAHGVAKAIVDLITA